LGKAIQGWQLRQAKKLNYPEINAVLMGPLQRYINARVEVFQDNVKDIEDSIKNGYWEEILHFLGAESPSILSQRMEIRRAWARQQILNPGKPKPVLPEITGKGLPTD